MKKQDPKDILDSIESSAVDDAIDRALAASDAEQNQALTAAGFDMAALHAKAAAVHGQLFPVVAKVVAWSIQKALLVAVASTLLLGVPAGYALGRWLSPPPAAPVPLPPPSSAPSTTAAPAKAPPPLDVAMIRAMGLEACKATHWETCNDALDFARDLDPAGDRAPIIQRAREEVMAALTGDGGESLPAKAIPLP